jgi:TrmH family RNA methyltransferase
VLITSKTNPRVKAIRRLFIRKHRDRARLFPVEGARLLREALSAGAEVDTLLVAPAMLSEEARDVVRRLMSRSNAPALEMVPEVLASIFPEHGGQGVAAVLRQRWHSPEAVVMTERSCLLAAKQIRQPWSIGNLIRTCDAVAAEGVILVGESTDPYHPTAVRASIGTVFSQRLIGMDLARLAAWKQREGCLIVGASPHGAVDYRDVEYSRPVVLFMGSERVGLSAEEEAICDLTVQIPMAGRCDSHHVAIAAGLLMYEISRQQAPPER